MINNDNESPDRHDDDFVRTLRLLRGIEPTVASRVKNRKVIAAALARGDRSAARATWWRQSVSIPVPIATAASVVFLGLVLGWVPQLIEADVGSETVPGSTAVEHEGSFDSSERALDGRKHEVTPLEYRASATYLCGVGQIRYESAYYFPED